MPPAAPLSSSSQTNGVSSSSGAAGKERTQSTEPRNKGKGQARTQLEQVIEEELPTPVSEPTPPAKKKQKRGLLVQKKPTAVEKKKAFSLDMDSSDESTDEAETQDEVEEEEQENDRAETTVRDAFDEGLSKILDDDGAIEGDVVMVDNADEEQEEEEDEESLPDIIPAKPKGKQAKAKPESVKQKAAASRKAKAPPPEKVKPNDTEKPAKGKLAKEKTRGKDLEPAQAVKSKPALKSRGKKVVPESPEETEEEEMEEVEREPTPPPPKEKVKATTKSKGKGKGRAAVEKEPEREPTPPPPPPPPRVKIPVKGKGKGRAKVVKEIEEILESEQEQEAVEEDPEEQEQEEQDEQPAKKRSRTTKEKAPPKQKLSAKAKGKAPAAPLKEKANKRNTQKAKDPSPELQSFTPSSPPAPITSKSKAKATKTTKAPVAEKSSKSLPSSQPASDKVPKKLNQRVIKEPPPPPRAPSEDMEGVRRSTRPRVEPLAFWKNEKIVYGLGARRKSGRPDDIRLPEVLEILRVESDSEAERERKERRKRSYAAASSKVGAKRKRAAKEEEEEDEFEEEDWESRTVDGEVGVVRGYVKSYPPADTPGGEELEEVELAFSRNRIVTVEVANGDFTFVKTCTEEFFGTGMIEVPPGGIKRTKNSGKMHLVFYMLSGKVEVKVGENSFRVRKGAQFMVPRGMILPFYPFC